MTKYRSAVSVNVRSNGYLFYACLLFVFAMSLWIRMKVPLFPIYGSMHDDELLGQQGFNIFQGNWLGPWSQFTLIKGPLYPELVSFSLAVNTSPIFIAHMLLIFSYMLFTISLSGLISRAQQILLFILLSLNPLLFGASASRVYRDILTLALALLVFTFVVLWFRYKHFEKNSFRGLVERSIILFSIGTFYGLLNLTRIGNYWLILSIFCLSFIFTTYALNVSKAKKRIVATLMISLLPLTSIALGNKSLQNVVAEKNYETYGYYIVDDYASGQFSRLLSVISSIDSDEASRFTFINSEQRNIAYMASPTLNEISATLEKDLVPAWMVHSCNSTGICDDLAGGWMPFAFRDAYRNTYSNLDAKSFQVLTKRAADEITESCKRQYIECGSLGLAPGLPAVTEIDWLKSAELSIWNAFRVIKSDDILALNVDQQPVGGSTEFWNAVQQSKANSTDVYSSNEVRWGTNVYKVISFGFFAVFALGTLLFVTLGYAKRGNLLLIGVGFTALLAFIGQLATISIMSANAWGESANPGYFLPSLPYISVVAVIGIGFVPFRLGQRLPGD